MVVGNTDDYQLDYQIDQLVGMYSYDQVFNEPTNFESHCEPPCVDLIFCSQQNLIQNSCTYASLFERCHHQIFYAKVNFEIF